MDPNLSPVTAEVYRNICRKFWSTELVADDSAFEGKAGYEKVLEEYHALRGWDRTERPRPNKA